MENATTLYAIMRFANGLQFTGIVVPSVEKAWKILDDMTLSYWWEKHPEDKKLGIRCQANRNAFKIIPCTYVNEYFNGLEI